MGAKQDENKTVALTLMKAMETGDWTAVRELIAEDGTWWIAGEGFAAGAWPRDKFVTVMSGVVAEHRAGPFTFTPITLTAEEDRVCVEAVSNMKLKNGKTYHNEYHILIQFRDGKIKSVREYMDTKHVSEAFS
jgi:uncharacterized protein